MGNFVIVLKYKQQQKLNSIAKSTFFTENDAKNPAKLRYMRV